MIRRSLSLKVLLPINLPCWTQLIIYQFKSVFKQPQEERARAWCFLGYRWRLRASFFKQKAFWIVQQHGSTFPSWTKSAAPDRSYLSETTRPTLSSGWPCLQGWESIYIFFKLYFFFFLNEAALLFSSTGTLKHLRTLAPEIIRNYPWFLSDSVSQR